MEYFNSRVTMTALINTINKGKSEDNSNSILIGYSTKNGKYILNNYYSYTIYYHRMPNFYNPDTVEISINRINVVVSSRKSCQILSEVNVDEIGESLVNEINYYYGVKWIYEEESEEIFKPESTVKVINYKRFIITVLINIFINIFLYFIILKKIIQKKHHYNVIAVYYNIEIRK